MLAARLHAPENLRLEELPRPLCPPGGALIRVRACGICASDLKMWQRGHKELTLPRVLGHEICGEIAELDAGAQGLEPGQAVQVFPGITCGTCGACLSGRENLCPGVKVLGFSQDGGMAEYLALPGATLAQGGLNPVPAGLDMVRAVLAEPLACALNALEQARMRAGQKVAILGAGLLGRLLALAARHLGAGAVAVLDVDPEHLRGLPGPCAHILPENAASQAKELLNGPAQVAVPACPDAKAIHWGLDMLEPGGCLVLFSGLNENPRLDLNQLHYQQKTLTGAYGCTATQNRKALAMLANGDWAAGLISRCLGLDQVEAAMRLASRPGSFKVVLEP